MPCASPSTSVLEEVRPARHRPTAHRGYELLLVSEPLYAKIDTPSCGFVIDVHDRLGKSLRCLLRKVVAYSASDRSVRVAA
jgi:hypothetical protein